ncbi:hypothetical protein BaRGS_00010002 [Batillaria attramentaria]|uniref:Uncharacterized protein n=1 Tax=Batillaria attramentaria TaxID=370345 RepID=A0ABD0LHN9_9CAEN
MTRGNGNTYTTTTALPTTTSTHSGPDDHEADQSPLDKSDSPSLTDTIAAITIAVLACVLIITLTLIIRALHRRRVRERGRELNIVPTVSTGIVNANVNAYGGHNPPRPVNGVITWEPVTPSTSSSNVMVTASTSGAPSNC